ncbi:uncharacterized protein LOC131626448 [Vicia villosa]|uniref:uncharacterized protein LOC131626448 n=1 Tax=Vicia villosa TaxID=3911 RepID=UPI00273C03D8|nr:uncharacterized protein LOC131626448 [Vicia villosa]
MEILDGVHIITTLPHWDQIWSSVLKVLSMVDEDERGPSQTTVDDVKARLATMRESGRDNLFADLQKFCVAKEIFYVAIDKICVEMDHRFSDGSSIILDCFSCLNPKNYFSKFDIDKLARLAVVDIYHAKFLDDDRGIIRDQLETYVFQVKRHVSFSTCVDVQSLAMKMV